MAGITYNGAIKVLPCDFINIPEPGILVDVTAGNQTALFNGGAQYTAANGGNNPTLRLFNNYTTPQYEYAWKVLYDQVVSQNVSGGDVIYLTLITGAYAGSAYPLQIEKVDFTFLPDGRNEEILFELSDNQCAPPNDMLWALNARIFGLEIYRGNYASFGAIAQEGPQPRGLEPLAGGFVGAGNSEGYSLMRIEAAAASDIEDILTVNNDRIQVPISYPSLPLDLLTVKNYCGSGNNCENLYGNSLSAGGYVSNIVALKVQQ